MNRIPLHLPAAPLWPAALVRAVFALVVLAAPLIAAGPAGAQLSGMAQRDGMPTLAPLMDRVTPGVVNIAVKGMVASELNPLLNDPFFRRFFNLPEMNLQREFQSVGSGVIVDARRGYVLTNNHVIKNADEITVTLKDGRKLKAELLGTDPATDIAVLRVRDGGMTAVPMGNSDRVQVGDFVIAIGNPFGLGQTVTSGIVSALGRSGINLEGFENFIQTDASINPGNSGGALVDLMGRLIGINTAIIAPVGGNVGIGFAVPVNMARAVMRQIIEHGEVRRGQLGVIVQDLTPELAEALGIDRRRGVVVTEVRRGSPAERAGLRASDVIVAIDGRRIANTREIRNRIALKPVGSRVELRVLRGGERLTVSVTIERVQPPESAGAGADDPAAGLEGAEFRDIPASSPLHGRVKGALVEGVYSGSPAWRRGLRPGDLILAVNRARIHSLAEFREQVRRARKGAMALHIQRRDRQLLIVVK